VEGDFIFRFNRPGQCTRHESVHIQHGLRRGILTFSLGRRRKACLLRNIRVADPRCNAPFSSDLGTQTRTIHSAPSFLPLGRSLGVTGRACWPSSAGDGNARLRRPRQRRRCPSCLRLQRRLPHP
jgi:hypothetical protein